MNEVERVARGMQWRVERGGTTGDEEAHGGTERERTERVESEGASVNGAERPLQADEGRARKRKERGWARAGSWRVLSVCGACADVRCQ